MIICSSQVVWERIEGLAFLARSLPLSSRGNHLFRALVIKLSQGQSSRTSRESLSSFSNSSDRRFESIRRSGVPRSNCGGVRNSFFVCGSIHKSRSHLIWQSEQFSFTSASPTSDRVRWLFSLTWCWFFSHLFAFLFASFDSPIVREEKKNIYIHRRFPPTSLLPIHLYEYSQTEGFSFSTFKASISDLSTFVSSLTIRRSLSLLDIFFLSLSLSILVCRCPSPTMTKFPSLSKQLTLLLIVLVLKLSIDFSQSATVAHPLFDDDAMVEEDNSGENLQRRADDLQKLRHFLLTSNAEQRASRRQQQDLSKRELVSDHPKLSLWMIHSCSVVRYANTFVPWKTRIRLKQSK